MACIANATTKPEDCEREITPEMLRAGLVVFRAYDVYDLFLDDELEDFAARVYVAMENARTE